MATDHKNGFFDLYAGYEDIELPKVVDRTKVTFERMREIMEYAYETSDVELLIIFDLMAIQGKWGNEIDEQYDSEEISEEEWLGTNNALAKSADDLFVYFQKALFARGILDMLYPSEEDLPSDRQKTYNK